MRVNLFSVFSNQQLTMVELDHVEIGEIIKVQVPLPDSDPPSTEEFDYEVLTLNSVSSTKDKSDVTVDALVSVCFCG